MTTETPFGVSYATKWVNTFVPLDIKIIILGFLPSNKLIQTFLVDKSSNKIDLESIDVSNTDIADLGLLLLKGVLGPINLSSCDKITDLGLEHLKGVLGALWAPGFAGTINLSGCKQITDKGLKHLKGAYYIALRSTLMAAKGIASLKGSIV